MLTDREVNNIINQVNLAFQDVRDKLEELEKRLQVLEKPVTPRGRKKTEETA